MNWESTSHVSVGDLHVGSQEFVRFAWAGVIIVFPWYYTWYYFKGLRPWAGSARRSPGRAVSKHVEAPKLP